MTPKLNTASQLGTDFGDITLTDDAVVAARRTVCQHAIDITEAEQFLYMLGIHPRGVLK